MEAATLKKNKTTISKGKIKKTMKNVLCRPDPMFWPVVTEHHENEINSVLKKYKVDIPTFHKPHWNEIKLIPKEKRPKMPKPKKVEGLLFGVTTCAKSILNGSCDAVIIDANVNPRLLVQNVIDACVKAQVPILCLQELKKVTRNYFGFPTCCLGVIKGESCVFELRNTITNVSKSYGPPKRVKEMPENNKIEVNEVKGCEKKEDESSTFTYLYRTSKQSRIFTPPTDGSLGKAHQGFIGQDFIEFGSVQKQQTANNKKSYMNMIVKRITNNPNRKKK